jgi:hypothetical protein
MDSKERHVKSHALGWYLASATAVVAQEVGNILCVVLKVSSGFPRCCHMRSRWVTIKPVVHRG